ncbi:MAG TPA: ABC transporter ATP-binding protein [Streptosporangiaceae bacterium]|nr:ABC transporter ATP-binding protein [Streptosporangiaceae bacterium]
MAPRTSGSLTAPATAVPAADSAPAARVRGLTRDFGDRRILDRLDLDIAPGEFVALIGRSGTGKSTLLRALAGLDRAVTGELEVTGTAAVAFQEPRLIPWRRVSDNVRLGLRPADPAAEPRAIARGALDEVGLTGRADAWPLTLSGGEAQRAALARALVREPSLLLLDEPFSALDALTRISMHRLVLRLWAHHQPAVLLVTHDVDEAIALADRVLVLADGRIAYSGQITLPRPRDRDHPELSALRNQLLGELGVGTDAGTSVPGSATTTYAMEGHH